jgi:hypothetical protein
MMADITQMAARSGKVIRSDNTIVNEADGINDDGSRNVKLTGSSVALLREVLADTSHIGKDVNYQRFYGQDNNGLSSGVKPLDVSKVKNRMVLVRNNYDVAVNVRFRIYKSASPGNSLTLIIPASQSLAAGASMIYDAVDLPKLNSPYLGLAVEVFNNGTTSPTLGSIDVLVFGGAI